MNYYIISYDLFNHKDYRKIKLYIQSSAKDWIKPLNTTYLIQSDLQLIYLKEMLTKALDTDDKILVIQIDPNNIASYNLEEHEVRWILNHQR